VGEGLGKGRGFGWEWFGDDDSVGMCHLGKTRKKLDTSREGETGVFLNGKTSEIEAEEKKKKAKKGFSPPVSR